MNAKKIIIIIIISVSGLTFVLIVNFLRKYKIFEKEESIKK